MGEAIVFYRRHGLTDISIPLDTGDFAAVWVSGGTWLFIAILFLGGAQLLCAGVLGAYLGRIYGEVKRRPLYLVKEWLGFPPAGRRAVRGNPADE